MKNREQLLSMKFYLIVAATTLLFSSCLKQSIPDAMLASKESSTEGAATLSYELNGNPVKISVAGNQNLNSYRLRCEKSVGFYALSGLSSSGETTFLFFTDSLTTGKYTYTGNYGDMFFISYNGQNAYAHNASDNLSFTISSYDKGHISGSFSGKLTPLITAGNPNNTYGTPSSIIITNGSFQNVKVFY
jgi:hypothetical protein